MGLLLLFVCHCFDRVIILGQLPLPTRAENIVYFFRHVHGVPPITPEVLRKKTSDEHRWVEAIQDITALPAA